MPSEDNKPTGEVDTLDPMAVMERLRPAALMAGKLKEIYDQIDSMALPMYTMGSATAPFKRAELKIVCEGSYGKDGTEMTVPLPRMTKEIALALGAEIVKMLITEAERLDLSAVALFDSAPKAYGKVKIADDKGNPTSKVADWPTASPKTFGELEALLDKAKSKAKASDPPPPGGDRKYRWSEQLGDMAEAKFGELAGEWVSDDYTSEKFVQVIPNQNGELYGILPDGTAVRFRDGKAVKAVATDMAAMEGEKG